MSPTILRMNKLRIMIHTDDHHPPHIHVVGPNAGAKIEIDSLQVISSYGFSSKALKRILAFLEKNKPLLIGAWNEIHEE